MVRRLVFLALLIAVLEVDARSRKYRAGINNHAGSGSSVRRPFDESRLNAKSYAKYDLASMMHPSRHAKPHRKVRSAVDCQQESILERKVDCLLELMAHQETSGVEMTTVVGGSAAARSIRPNPMGTNYTGVVNVMAFGALGNGQNDDTGAFQNALDYVYNNGGGVVFAPTGLFRIDGALQVPNGVAIVGTYRCVTSHTGLEYSGMLLPTDGTIFQLYGNPNSNDTSLAAFTLNQDSVLEGAVIYYPDQVVNGTPTAYPPAIAMINVNAAVFDVELLNPYYGIYAVGAHRHYIARVQGQPLYRGIFIDQTYDIGRVEDVHFNPWYSMEKGLMEFQRTYGVAFEIARSDWEYMLNTFAWGYDVGYLFVASSYGSCNGNFLGIGADYTRTAAVYVVQADTWGILITNGEFTTFGDDLTAAPDPTQVLVAPGNTGSVTFVNSAFWGPSNQIALISGDGWVGFSDCIFLQWDNDNTGRAAIQVTQNASVSVTGNDFMMDGYQVSTDFKTKRAVVVANLMVGALRVVDNLCPFVMVGYNAAF